MPQLPRKAPSRCPHCGFVQDEPEHLISTYCRGCGSYYKVAPASGRLAKYSSEVRTRIRRQFAKIPPRQVRCYHCGQIHEVSGRARTTICPECNAAIELLDVNVSSSTTRPIDTRGNLIITPSGYISSALTVCHEALIAGKVSGTLVSETLVRVVYSGRLSCQIKAKSMVIEKESRVEFSYPIETDELIVYGQAAGNFECAGRIWIDKGGSVEGRIAAHSVIVEDGGVLRAESSVRPKLTEDSMINEETVDVLVDEEHPLPA
jgi:cytoskeletal protein CcmA (bactofilin family)